MLCRKRGRVGSPAGGGDLRRLRGMEDGYAVCRLHGIRLPDRPRNGDPRGRCGSFAHLAPCGGVAGLGQDARLDARLRRGEAGAFPRCGGWPTAPGCFGGPSRRLGMGGCRYVHLCGDCGRDSVAGLDRIRRALRCALPDRRVDDRCAPRRGCGTGGMARADARGGGRAGDNVGRI